MSGYNIKWKIGALVLASVLLGGVGFAITRTMAEKTVESWQDMNNFMVGVNGISNTGPFEILFLCAMVVTLLTSLLIFLGRKNFMKQIPVQVKNFNKCNIEVNSKNNIRTAR